MSLPQKNDSVLSKVILLLVMKLRHKIFSLYTTKLVCNSNLRQLRTKIFVESPSKKESDKIA